MKDSDWEILYRLYKTPNITKVANILYISQPSLTRRLKGIEEEFNIKIVSRTSKGVTFTPEGEYLAKKAENYMDFIKEALTLGFNNAAVIDVKDLVFVLEYRQFCEENLCGNFNVISSCPPACGTPEEMHRKALNYKKALILQTVLESPEEQFDVKKAKYNHNILTEKLYKKIIDQSV